MRLAVTLYRTYISYLVEISIGIHDLLSARPTALFSQVPDSSCDKVIVRQ